VSRYNTTSNDEWIATVEGGNAPATDADPTASIPKAPVYDPGYVKVLEQRRAEARNLHYDMKPLAVNRFTQWRRIMVRRHRFRLVQQTGRMITLLVLLTCSLLVWMGEAPPGSDEARIFAVALTSAEAAVTWISEGPPARLVKWARS
jgi:hypothetical protein